MKDTTASGAAPTATLGPLNTFSARYFEPRCNSAAGGGPGAVSTKSLTRESRFDPRLQIRGGSLELRRSDGGRVAYFASLIRLNGAWKARLLAPARHLRVASRRRCGAMCRKNTGNGTQFITGASARQRLRCESVAIGRRDDGRARGRPDCL